MPFVRLEQRGVQFLKVCQPVVIGVRDIRPRSPMLLFNVCQPVPVQILVSVPCSIPVCIHIHRVGAGQVFIVVVQPISVRVAVGPVDPGRIIRIEPVKNLPPIRQSIAVGILIRILRVDPRQRCRHAVRHGHHVGRRRNPVRDLEITDGMRSDRHSDYRSAVVPQPVVHAPLRPIHQRVGRPDVNPDEADVWRVRTHQRNRGPRGNQHALGRRRNPARGRGILHQVTAGRQILDDLTAGPCGTAIHFPAHRVLQFRGLDHDGQRAVPQVTPGYDRSHPIAQGHDLFSRRGPPRKRPVKNAVYAGRQIEKGRSAVLPCASVQ